MAMVRYMHSDQLNYDSEKYHPFPHGVTVSSGTWPPLQLIP